MLDEPWCLSPNVALRPEPFGALAYNFGTRRLTFLKRPELVTVVSGLNAGADVKGTLTAANVPEWQWPVFIQALESLAEAGMIERRPAGDKA